MKLFFVYSYDTPYIKIDLELLRNHFTIIKGEFLNPSRRIGSILDTIKTIVSDTRRSDLVFVWFADSRALFSIITARILHKPVIVVIGGYEVTSLPQYKYGGLRKPLSRFKVKFILKFADKLIAVSAFSAGEINKLTHDEKTEILPLCIEANEEKPPKKQKIVLTVGKATKEKYLLKGLNRFAETAALMKEYQFVIAGEFENEIKTELLETCKNLIFTGKLTSEELLVWYRKSIVYCQLSERESFGFALLEAMNQGCIPVVRNTGSLPEVIGSAGLILFSDDAREAVRAIKQAATWRPDIPIKRVKSHFDLKTRESRLCDLIKRLI